MKTIKSENYKKLNIISQYAGDGNFNQKLENIKEQVHMGADVYEAIGTEFPGLDSAKIAQIKDFVMGALYGTTEQPAQPAQPAQSVQTF